MSVEFEENRDRSHEILHYSSHGFEPKEISEFFGLTLETVTRLLWDALNDPDLVVTYEVTKRGRKSKNTRRFHCEFTEHK